MSSSTREVNQSFGPPTDVHSSLVGETFLAIKFLRIWPVLGCPSCITASSIEISVRKPWLSMISLAMPPWSRCRLAYNAACVRGGV